MVSDRKENWYAKRELEQVEATNVANRHPLNRRALELLRQAGAAPTPGVRTVGLPWLHAFSLMLWRLYPPADYYPVVAPDLENMRWGWQNYDYNMLEMKIHAMMSDWTPKEILNYLTQGLETGELLIAAWDENSNSMTVVDALNAAQTPEDGGKILLDVLGEQMSSDTRDLF